jgi:hypothetical protein
MKKTPCLKFPVREQLSKDGNVINHNRIIIWAGVHRLMITWKRNSVVEGMMGLSKKKFCRGKRRRLQTSFK